MNFCCLAELPAATTNESPDFNEVYDLLRAHLAGSNGPELNRAAVKGLLQQLPARVALSGDSAGEKGNLKNESALRSTVFDRSYGYLRISEVGAGIEKTVADAYQKLLSSNRLKGLVIDLRFSGGSDYAAAAALADLFYSAEKPLLDFGDGVKKSTAKTNAILLPLALVVNKQTSGAAEAFAGALRQADIGLVIGTNTAGKATIGKEFPLNNGQRLWIATSLVKLADGKPFPTEGLAPDIQVEVRAEDELAYLEDAYKTSRPGLTNAPASAAQLATNRVPHHRTTEAELVRMHRDGELPNAALPVRARDLEPPPHVVSDPALARALDLLKGLSVVQQFRAN